MRLALIAAGFLTALTVSAHAQSGPKTDPWPDLVTNVFNDRPIEDGTGVLSLEAPTRAEDAALVPITIRSELPAGSDLRVQKITLVIDENPSPVAAEFEFGAERSVTQISTRVRVDAYTNIHAVAELSDGKLYSVAKFVKASGGCSAPASKNPGEALADLGEMRFRWFDPTQGAAAPISDGLLEAQLMIRHPNNSGLQMDQITRTYTPAFFIRDISVKAGDDLLFRMLGGISISENPSFRFVYAGAENEPIAVEAVDTDENAFRGNWSIPEPGAS
jgi:sulfur-oxidizing protein SoxY